MASSSFNKLPIIAGIGDRLGEVLKQYSRITHENTFYDQSLKTLDPTKILPSRELRRYLEAITSGGGTTATIFEKFFDVSMGRSGRYSEYEQIVQRIPEAARALQLYVDSILSPNLGYTDNQLVYTKLGGLSVSDEAKEILQAIINKTKFEEILGQIIYTTLLYGDCFLEVDSTSSGVRYIIHSPKNCTLIHDSRTDVEMGIVIQIDSSHSKLLDMLSYAYPNIRVAVPNSTVAIVSDKVFMADTGHKNAQQIASVENQMADLLSDVLKDYGAKYRYLTPNKYIRFSIFYNNLYYPYGTSILDPVRSIAKQLLLVESALAIYRATRTPLRTLWTVEVGNTPEDQIHSLVEGVQNRIRRQTIVDRSTESSEAINSIPEMMAIEDDVWTPSINGNPLIKLEPITPPDISNFIEDADYFRKKLIGALGIPPSYLAEETGGSTRALLTLEDVNFSRTIKKYQMDINHGLDDFNNTCFYLIKKPHYANTLTLKLPSPRTIEDNMRVQNLGDRMNAVGSFMDSFEFVPKLWVLKNIAGFTDDDIDSMIKAKNDEKNNALFANNENSSEDDGRSFGGMRSFSGGGGGIAEDFENDMGTLGNDEENVTENDNTVEGPLGDIDLGDIGVETTPLETETTSPNANL